MLETGLIVTLIGMAVVFSFLVILVFAMNITSKIILFINKFFPEVQAESVKVTTNNDTEIALAIAAVKLMNRGK